MLAIFAVIQQYFQAFGSSGNQSSRDKIGNHRKLGRNYRLQSFQAKKIEIPESRGDKYGRLTKRFF